MPHHWLKCFSIPMRSQFLDAQKRMAKGGFLKGSISHIVTLMNSSPLIRDFIYPEKLTTSETTKSTPVAFYLDLLSTRDKSNNITTKLYDSHDTFGFHIVNFPFMSSNIPSNQLIVSLHFNLFAIPVVVQIITIFGHATWP